MAKRKIKSRKGRVRRGGQPGENPGQPVDVSLADLQQPTGPSFLTAIWNNIDIIFGLCIFLLIIGALSYYEYTKPTHRPDENEG